MLPRHASAASTHWSGGSGGSAWVIAGVLRGSGGSVSADGGGRHGNGDAGGGGGRIALYCTASAYGSNDSAHGWALLIPDPYVVAQSAVQSEPTSPECPPS